VRLTSRKPESVGIELQSVADGDSRLQLGLEMQEGNDYMRDQEFNDKVTSKGTSQVLRLVYKVGSQYDADLEVRHAVAYQIDCPRVLQLYFKSTNAIDVHNHPRQGILRMEDAFGSRDWTMALYSTLFGMIVTDAFLAFGMLRRNSAPSVKEFALVLAAQMMSYNDAVLTRSLSAPRLANGEAAAASSTAPARSPTFGLLSTLDRYSEKLSATGNPARAQLTCAVCHSKASFFCESTGCSTAKSPLA
jgi:hypothetical protein